MKWISFVEHASNNHFIALAQKERECESVNESARCSTEREHRRGSETFPCAFSILFECITLTFIVKT